MSNYVKDSVHISKTKPEMPTAQKGNILIGELLYTPLLVLVILIISALSVAIVISKRSSSGLINPISSDSPYSQRGATQIVHISTGGYNNTLNAPASWGNRVIYISADKADLGGPFLVNLFDPTSVSDGTLISFFNSPLSIWPARVLITWVGSASEYNLNPSVRVSLGTGQGATLITSRRIGPHEFVQVGGSDILDPDLTPSELQPRDWLVHKYWDPQGNVMCSSVNGCTNCQSVNSALFRVDNNVQSPCIGAETNSDIGVTTGTNCISLICNCPEDSAVDPFWPHTSSPWCNFEISAT